MKRLVPINRIQWLSEGEMFSPTNTLADIVSDVRPYFTSLLAKAQSLRINPIIRSVGRTCEEQLEQVKLGYSQTDLCRSMHVLGHAVDLSLTPATCENYTKLGQWWEAQGGIWGGRWKQFGACGDAGHFQYGFNRAQAVPINICPSGVTLQQCNQIRESYLSQQLLQTSGVSPKLGLIGGAIIIGIGMLFVLSTLKMRAVEYP